MRDLLRFFWSTPRGGTEGYFASCTVVLLVASFPTSLWYETKKRRFVADPFGLMVPEGNKLPPHPPFRGVAAAAILAPQPQQRLATRPPLPAAVQQFDRTQRCSPDMVQVNIWLSRMP